MVVVMEVVQGGGTLVEAHPRAHAGIGGHLLEHRRRREREAEQTLARMLGRPWHFVEVMQP